MSAFRLELPLERGTLQRRYKRFLADVEVQGETRTVHCANPGRMVGLDQAGLPVVISDSGDPKRKLRHSLEYVLVDDGDGATWVGVNTLRANALAESGLRLGLLPRIDAGATVRREVSYGADRRVDLVAEPGAGPRVFVEVKNATLARRHQDGTLEALFPDAVTERGRRHLEALADVVAGGERAMLLYLVNRHDCRRFAQAGDVDPAYASAARAARAAGVEMVALQVRHQVRAAPAPGPLPSPAAVHASSRFVTRLPVRH